MFKRIVSCAIFLIRCNLGPVQTSNWHMKSSMYESIKIDRFVFGAGGYQMVFASMRAMCLFLRARAAVKIFLRAASTLENTDGEQRAL